MTTKCECVKYRKSITFFPQAYHATKLEVEGNSWDECNKQLLKEYKRLKNTLPKEEQKIAEEQLNDA